MACQVSCMFSIIFIIGMIYFYNISNKSEIIKYYKNTLPIELQKRYDKISKERMMISYQGYTLGALLSIGLIFYNLKFNNLKITNLTLACYVITIAFITNYFYYILHPKSDWMLNHMNNQKEVKAWLIMYREMQFNYHIGLVFGIIALGVLAFAFRC